MALENEHKMYVNILKGEVATRLVTDDPRNKKVDPQKYWDYLLDEDSEINNAAFA